jgi:hypothetical protein
MSKPLVDRYIKDLLATYQYRVSMDRARFSPNVDSATAGVGVSAPSAMQLAMDAMRANTPPAVLAAKKPDENKPDSTLDYLLHVIKPVGMAVDGAEKLLNTGPVKAAIDIISRPAYAVGSALDEAANKGITAAPEAAWQGFTGKNKVLPSQALIGNDKGLLSGIDGLSEHGAGGKAAEFIARLGTDIALDPITYLPYANIASAGSRVINAGRAGEKALAAAAPLEGKIAASVPKGAPALEAPPVRQAIGPGSVAPSDVRFTAGADGIRDRVNPVAFADEVTAKSISDAVRYMPKKEFPNLEVDPLFRTTTEKSVQRVPQQVTETVDVPIEGKVLPKEAPKMSPALAEKRAIKMTILNTPEYKVLGKYPVADVLNAARKASDDPVKQGKLMGLIDDEVRKVFSTQDYSKLPGVARLLTSEGNAGSIGLTIEQAAKLFQEGKVPKVLANYEKKGAQASVDAFPLHSVEDTTRVFLNNAKGERVTLAKYFSDLGINLAKVDPVTGAAVGGKGTKGSKGSKIEFTGFPEELPPATKKVTRTKTVFTDVVTESQKTSRIDKAESVAWALKHMDRGLTKKEIAYLRAARTPESFKSRVEELSARTVFGNFKTLQDVVEAHKIGLIPDMHFKHLLSLVGAKNAEELLSKAKGVFKLNSAKAPKLEEQTKKFTRSTTIEASPWDVVDSVDTIIRKVADGDVSAVAHPLPALNETILKDAAAALDESILKNLIDPQDISKYPFLSGRVKAKRTSKREGEGLGRNLHGWNKYSQSDAFRSIVSRVSQDTRRTDLKGKELSRWLKVRPDVMFSRVLDAVNVTEAALRAKGVKLIAGDQNNGIMLSLGDVLNAMEPKDVKRFLFSRANGANRGNNVYPTKFLDVAETYVRAAQAGNPLELAREVAFKSLSTPGAGERLVAEKGAGEFLDSMERALPKILQRVNANYAEESIKIGESVKSMSDKVISDVIKSYSDPSVSMGDAFATLINRNSEMAKVGRAIGAPSEAYPVAGKIVDSELTSPAVGLRPGDLAEAGNAKKFTAAEMGSLGKAAQEQKAAEIGAAQQASRASEALRMADPATDLSDLHDIRLQAGIFRANAPMLDKAYALKDIAGRAFLASYGHADLHDMVHIEHNVTQSLARSHRRIMQTTFEIASKAYGPQAKDKLAEAFKMLQEGRTVVGDPAMDEIIGSMKNSIDTLFNGGPKGNFAARNGLFADHLNGIMDKYGVPGDYRFKGGKTLDSQVDAWRGWAEVKDPLDVLDKVHASYQRATMETTIARDFTAQWGKSTKAPGYVKIVDSKGASTIGKFIDSKMYYPREIVEQLPYLDTFLDNSIFKTGPLMRVYDEVLHMWKAGVTIYRPGHHVRNLVGDVGLSFLAGLNNPKHYKNAARILGGRSSAYSKEWDALRALQTGAESTKSAVGKTTQYRVGRKSVPITDDEVWRAAFNQGLLPDYSVLEDTLFNEGQSMMKIAGVSIRKPFGGKVQEAAGGISQARDHWVRIAHFTHALEKYGKSAKSLDELFAVAGKEVRKWHPDGSDLTAFERQGMRRVIPFYSWFRKAIPLVVEAFAMKPGRAMVMPKAMYDFAETMGMDPDSLANPFPEDLLLPGWLTEKVLGPQFEGPEGNLYGINPGDPVSDLGSGLLGANPGGDIMGGITPAIRMPGELATGTSWGTGTRLKDNTEYLGQNIPGISILQNILNRDVLGGMQPTQEVQRGYADGMDQTALLNTLTGLGITNFTKPQYLKSGQLEYRDKLRNN